MLNLETAAAKPKKCISSLFFHSHFNGTVINYKHILSAWCLSVKQQPTLVYQGRPWCNLCQGLSHYIAGKWQVADHLVVASFEVASPHLAHAHCHLLVLPKNRSFIGNVPVEQIQALLNDTKKTPVRNRRVEGISSDKHIYIAISLLKWERQGNSNQKKREQKYLCRWSQLHSISLDHLWCGMFWVQPPAMSKMAITYFVDA